MLGDKFFVIDSGIFFDIARRISETCNEGDKVYYFNIAEKKAFPKIEEFVGMGFTDIIKIDTIPWAIISNKNSIFVFTDTGLDFLASLLRQQGFKVFGGFDKLEEDRNLAAHLAQKIGISVPERFTFRSFRALKEGLRYIPRDWGKIVFKVSKIRGTIETHTFETRNDFLDFVNLLEHKFIPFDGYIDLILQKYIEGIEVAISAFFNGREFIQPVLVNFEHNIGGFGFWEGNNFLLEKLLLPFRDFFSKINWRGIIDANCIIEEGTQNIVLLEFSVRFGSPISRLYGFWIQNFADLIRFIASGDTARIILKRFRFGGYCGGFKDLGAPISAFYPIDEFYSDTDALIVDCPVLGLDGQVYALSFFDRLVTGVALGNTTEEVFDKLLEVSSNMGAWVSKPDISALEKNVLYRLNAIRGIEDEEFR